MARRLPLPTIEPQVVHVQSLEAFTSDTERRHPTKTNHTVTLQWWSPTPVPSKEIRQVLAAICALGAKLLPSLTFAIAPPLELKESKDAVERYRKETYYKSNMLMQQVSVETYAHLIITPVGIVSRPTMLTAGRADRTTGVAIYSTYKDADPITAIHELAHVLGIRHCTNVCIMKAGSDGPLVKKKKVEPHTFCTTCQAKISVACSAL